MGTGFVVPEARAICRSKSIHKVINTKLGEELLILSFKVKPSSFGLGVEVGVVLGLRAVCAELCRCECELPSFARGVD